VPSAPDRPVVRLASDELMRGPWVYGRQVEPAPEVEDGALVEVHDASRRFVGHALYNGASDIRLRWLSRGRKNALDRPGEFLATRLKAADELRRRTLRLEEVSDAYRVCHAEGDDLPGLIVDRLNDLVVCELHSLGFVRLLSEVEGALERLYPGLARVARVPDAAARSEGMDERDRPPDGAPRETWIH